MAGQYSGLNGNPQTFVYNNGEFYTVVRGARDCGVPFPWSINPSGQIVSGGGIYTLGPTPEPGTLGLLGLGLAAL
jgi:PEP-CTERM motif